MLRLKSGSLGNSLDSVYTAHLCSLVVVRCISTATERYVILLKSSRHCLLSVNREEKLFQLSLLACR